jgi:hypothetical protein
MEKDEKKKEPIIHKNRYMTGEDIDMLREKNREKKRSKNDYNICDYHEDGA